MDLRLGIKMTSKVDDRQRIYIVAAFDIRAGNAAYNLFRNAAQGKIRRLEKELGSDAVLDYLALEIKVIDTIIRD